MYVFWIKLYGICLHSTAHKETVGRSSTTMRGERDQLQDAFVSSLESTDVCLHTTNLLVAAVNLSATSTEDGISSAINDEDDDLSKQQDLIDATHDEDEDNQSSMSALVTLACIQPPLSTAEIWRKTAEKTTNGHPKLKWPISNMTFS
jgi:hypothetical protein